MIYLKILGLNNNINNGDWLSKNDLYVKIYYGNQIRRTNVLWDNNIPIWNECFLLDNSISKHIKFEICDEDVYSPDEILETFVIDVNLGEIKHIRTDYLNIELGDIHYKKISEITELKNKNKKLFKKIKNLREENKTQKIIIDQIKTLCYNI